jgi:hypothetical protein
MRRARGQVVGLPEYTFGRANGRVVPVEVRITVLLPAGDERKSVLTAAIAWREAAVVAAAKARVPQKKIAHDWGMTQPGISRILSAHARRISPALRKGR